MKLDEFGLLDKQIKKISKELRKYGDIVKKPRNKLIGHLDRKSVRRGRTLGKHKNDKLNAFLNNIQQYCDLAGEKLGLGPLDFSSSSCKGDVLDLLFVLRRVKEERVGS